MDFFSKFTKPAEQSKPAASDGQEPNSTTESSNTELFSSAKVVAGAAQSYFSHQPATCDNTELAGATADILGAASEYGKLDKTQGVGKYVDQAENYLKDYETSNTPAAAAAAPTTTDTAAHTGGKSAPTTEAAETDTAATKGADASTEESSKAGSYGEETTTEALSSKPSAGDSAVKTDESDVYGEDKADGLPSKTPGGGAATKTDTGDDYTQSGGKYGEDTEGDGSKNLSGGGAAAKTDVIDDSEPPKEQKYEDTTEEVLTKKPAAAVADASEDYAKDTAESLSDKPPSGCAVTGADSEDAGYKEDTEKGFPKPSAGSHGAAVDDARDKVSQAVGGFGNFSKVAGDFLNK